MCAILLGMKFNGLEIATGKKFGWEEGRINYYLRTLDLII